MIDIKHIIPFIMLIGVAIMTTLLIAAFAIEGLKSMQKEWRK